MKTSFLKIFFTGIALLFANSFYGQKAKAYKADKEFDRFEYIDAREIYLKVVEDGYVSAQIYENLGDTYYWNSDYGNAANWYGRLIAEFPEHTTAILYYRAAQSHKSINKVEDSRLYMDKYIEMGGNPGILKASDTDFLEYIVQLDKVQVNSEYSDFGPAFYLNNIVFASSAVGPNNSKVHKWNNQPFTDLLIAKMDENGLLSDSMALGGDVNSSYHESTPTFTKDGKTMYFTRNNIIDGKKEKDDKKTLKLKLYKATNSGINNWTNIVELPFNSKNFSNAHPALSFDESRLYFSSEMPGGFGMSDIWYVDILGNNTYSEPVNLGPEINTEARESFSFISDKNNLYFSSDGRDGLGGYDIFISPLDENGKPGKITNLGEPANSAQDDFGFIMNEEKRFGYLTSNRDGEGGSIDDEIYLVREVCEIIIKGRVYDVDTGSPIPGATVTLLDENNKVLESIEVGEDALYSYALDCDQLYSIRGVKDSYAPFEQIVQTPNTTSTLDLPIPLKLIDPCPPSDLGCRLDLLPIYFDFDKYNIRPDAEIELAKVLNAMRQYPQLIIHIESHTDSRAPFKYNEALSERRAQATLSWLIARGIEPHRLSAKGYGENQLTNHCSDGVLCTEEEHQLNRRSMFIIQN